MTVSVKPAASLATQRDVHVHRLPGAQVHLRLDLDRLPRHERQPELSRKDDHVHMHFDDREMLADAGAGAQAERKIDEAVAGGIAFGQETVGIEALRVGPPVRMALDQVGRDEHVRARGKRIAADGGRLQGRRVKSHPGGIQAQRLVERAAGQGIASERLVGGRGDTAGGGLFRDARVHVRIFGSAGTKAN